MEEAAHEADRLAREYLHRYYGCAQTVLAAVTDALGLAGAASQAAFKAMVGLAGGVGLTGWGTCGALTGAAAAVGLCVSPEREEYEETPEARFEVYELAAELAEKFKERFGGITCREVQRALFGRHFDLRDPDQMREFVEGGFLWQCEEVVGAAARWAVEVVKKATRMP